MIKSSHIKYILLRLRNSFNIHGFAGTVYRLIRSPLLLLKTSCDRNRIFGCTDTAEVFTQIYHTNWWGSIESISGTGSTLAYTSGLRSKLPLLFDRYSIDKVLDAPCGDFNWMYHVAHSTDIVYIGCDIVAPLIQRNREKYESTRIQFFVFNLITDILPNADIWICRDCFIHFSFADILATLENFARSDIKYFLTTTHTTNRRFTNIDIQTGDARVIDLFSAPFYFPRDYLFAIDDWQKPDTPRILALFTHNQILEALPRMRSAISAL